LPVARIGPAHAAAAGVVLNAFALARAARAAPATSLSVGLNLKIFVKIKIKKELDTIIKSMDEKD
jgi:hypothetical protein